MKVETKSPSLYTPSSDNELERVERNVWAPLVICRCCGAPIEPKWQLGSGHKPGCYLVTCANESCMLCNYTFSVDRYNDVDLVPYIVTANTRH